MQVLQGNGVCAKRVLGSHLNALAFLKLVFNSMTWRSSHRWPSARFMLRGNITTTNKFSGFLTTAAVLCTSLHCRNARN